MNELSKLKLPLLESGTFGILAGRVLIRRGRQEEIFNFGFRETFYFTFLTFSN